MKLRNIAIIAHVDHGKTTLVDMLLKQSNTFRANQVVAERAMDKNALEIERGITILAKCTSILWEDKRTNESIRINIVDTPGHADFGGEVERILGMVDGVILLVDAAEGPLPQTKFVLGKALRLGLRPVVVVNKIDRGDARPEHVLNEIFDLFLSLDASDEQSHFPFLYASGRQGWAIKELTDKKVDLTPLFELIVDHVPAPKADPEKPFAMVVAILELDNYLGRVLTGRIAQGRIAVNSQIKALDPNSQQIETGRLTKILSFRGLERIPVESAEAGDIIALAGLTQATVSNTITIPSVTEALPAIPVDPPTLAIIMSVNDSPLAGREGDKVTSRQIRDRLMREAEGNIAIRVRQTDNADAFEVAGRGELQLGVLVETMRREGFELSLSRPRVLMREENGQTLEPIEEVIIDVDDEFSGTVIDRLSQRKADLVEMRPSAGKTRLVFHAPSRGLIGFHGEFLTATRGTGVINKLFHGYAPHKGELPGRRNGVLISTEAGETVAYALWNLEERGVILVNPGVPVYVGMIIGEHSRDNDLEVNPLKSKQLTNIRTTSRDEAVRLTPPRIFSLEQAMSYIADDELVEVTPKSIRLRKKHLDPNIRKRMEKAAS